MVVCSSIDDNLSWLTPTSSNNCPLIPCNPKLCNGFQDLLKDGRHTEFCGHWHDYKVEQFRIYTQRFGMMIRLLHHSLINVHMELSSKSHSFPHSLDWGGRQIAQSKSSKMTSTSTSALLLLIIFFGLLRPSYFKEERPEGQSSQNAISSDDDLTASIANLVTSMTMTWNIYFGIYNALLSNLNGFDKRDSNRVLPFPHKQRAASAFLFFSTSHMHIDRSRWWSARHTPWS